jgi:protoporphyrinogen oxidase
MSEAPAQVVIVGAGPAGLTAALELVRAGGRPLVIEAERQVGGISKTVEFDGNRMDLGGHRFFSKSDWVMQWWQEIFPVLVETPTHEPFHLAYQNRHSLFDPSHAVSTDVDGKVLLIRPRLSRIYHRRKFFDYPIRLNARTVLNLGLLRTVRIGIAYVWARLAPRRPERTLEDFLINRFGGELYRTFFKDYTEKVWGIGCHEISAEWGAQRIKGLSITKALAHAAGRLVERWQPASRKAVETSLIEQFLYPKLGPGQLWEEVARRVVDAGGDVRLGTRVTRVFHAEGRIVAVEAVNADGSRSRIECDTLVSTMSVRDFIRALDPPAPPALAQLAERLPYRDFLTVGLLVKGMRPVGSADAHHPSNANGMPPDNWIYIQEPDVKLGRLQIFNNWSPAMVRDPSKVFLGLEYFCGEGDALWRMEDAELIAYAGAELEAIGLIVPGAVEKGTVVRVPKAYPAYFGAYRHMSQIRAFLDGFANLFPIGRNGMHRYNNQDHSMLSAKMAVECILDPARDRRAIWDINTEEEYHEQR